MISGKMPITPAMVGQTLQQMAPLPNSGVLGPNLVANPGTWNSSPNAQQYVGNSTSAGMVSASPPVDAMSPAEVENALLKLALDPEKEGILTLMRSMIWNNMQGDDQQMLSNMRDEYSRLFAQQVRDQQKIQQLERLVSELRSEMLRVASQLPPPYSPLRVVAADPYRTTSTSPTATAASVTGPLLSTNAPTFDVTDWMRAIDKVRDAGTKK
jgi:hypothetical protein